MEEVSSQIAVKKMLSVIFWAVFVLAVICLGSFIGMLALAQVKLVSRIVIFSPQILEDCTNFCYSLFTVEIFLMSYGVALISLFAISLCFALAEVSI